MNPFVQLLVAVTALAIIWTFAPGLLLWSAGILAALVVLGAITLAVQALASFIRTENRKLRELLKAERRAVTVVRVVFLAAIVSVVAVDVLRAV